MTALAIEAHTVTTALGPGNDALWRGIRDGVSGLTRCALPHVDLDTWVGEVPGCMQTPMPAGLEPWDCRNNRLAELGLQQDAFRQAVAAAIQAYGAERVGLFLGTSTSGIGATEAAYREARAGSLPDWFVYEYTHDYFSVGGYVRARLGLEGPTWVMSTACSSSAKVFASAGRAIATGLCDAAIVGGIDSLCLTTLYGFNSLQLVSAEPCRPADTDRDGLSIGEAAGFALVRPAAGTGETRPQVLGWGESSDAYHMAAPEPEGEGAAHAMQEALEHAGLSASQIGYINLHGTATPANDLAEDRAVTRVFGDRVPASSTKGWTGHTLGAAGIVETVLGLSALERDWLPQSLNTRSLDPRIEADIVLTPRHASIAHVCVNSFGFGGSNCTLVLGGPA